jgi:hypothetical protein
LFKTTPVNNLRNVEGQKMNVSYDSFPNPMDAAVEARLIDMHNRKTNFLLGLVICADLIIMSSFQQHIIAMTASELFMT